MVMPFYFLPVIYDVFGLGKSGFLLLSGVVGMVLWVVSLLIDKTSSLKYSKWMWWMVVLLGWSLVTFFRMSLGGQARSISSSLGMGGLVGLVMWFFLWIQVKSKEEYQKQFNWLSISAILVGVISLVVFMIPTSRLPLLWPKDNPLVSITSNWSVTGSVLAELVLFLFLSIEWIKKLVTKLKNKVDFGEYFKEAIGAAFFGLMTFLSIYKLIKMGWVYLDMTSAWVIAVETLKNSPLFGVGLGNFVEAFSRFRPASFNMTPLWSNSFGVSMSGLLHWWTELGTVGLAIICAIIVMVWKKRKESGFAEVAVLGIIVLLLPPTFLTIFLLFWVMASGWGETKTVKLMLPLGEKGFNVMPYIVSVLLLVVSGFCGYKMIRAMMADYYWRQSLVASSKNDGTNTYNFQIKAIAMNSNLSDYRAMYAQTNLALAQNFLSGTETKDITEENKQKASTLVQQAVREAQAAVNLDKNVSAYWSNLGAIYKSLIGSVDSTLDWSVQSYQQASALDSVSPTIPMELGSIAYGSGDYASAERYFEDSIKNKKDYANAWYNWAYAAKKQNKLQDAVTRLEQAVKLVPTDSIDYEKANTELDGWKKELEEATKKYNEQLKQQQQATMTPTPTPENLKTAQPLPTVGKEEKVNVPAKDLEPPEN